MKRATKIALINGLIAAGLVFFGAFTSGTITPTVMIAASAAAITAFLTNIKAFIDNSRKKKTNVTMGVLNFYGF